MHSCLSPHNNVYFNVAFHGAELNAQLLTRCHLLNIDFLCAHPKSTERERGQRGEDADKVPWREGGCEEPEK